MLVRLPSQTRSWIPYWTLYESTLSIPSVLVTNARKILTWLVIKKTQGSMDAIVRPQSHLP
jgi:hypothetical protein